MMRQNLLTNLNVIYLSDDTQSRWANGSAVDTILYNTAAYDLPFEQPLPFPFSARYMCQKMVWKTPANLTVDVLVATTSLFMAYWGILNFLLKYIATASVPHGKSSY